MTPGVTDTPAQWVEAGLALHQAGRLDEARALYERALQHMPRHADALHLLGVIAMQQTRYADALDLIARAIEISPQAMYYDNLGCSLRGWGKLEAAAESHQQAIALDPGSASAHNNLGLVLLQMRLPAAAAASFRRAVECRPNFADAHCNLGNVLREMGDFERAAEHCRTAIALKPTLGEAHNNLGNALKEQGKLAEAAACYRQALALIPHDAQVPLNLGIVLREQGRHEAAIECFKQALTLQPTWQNAWGNLLFSLSFAEGASPEQYLATAIEYGKRTAAQARPYTDWLTRSADAGPLRIGFVSGDLRTHPVGFFLEGVLGRLDRTRVELFAYTTKPKEDDLTARIKPLFNGWRSLTGLTDEAAARTIRDDGIHILLDLAGHTDGSRVSVFAWKPAPVQASWIGYFASTGLTAIDYVIGDDCVLPANEAHHFIERPWRLPRGYLCFTPPADVASDAAAESARPLTFGSFGDLVKVNDRVTAVWARILREVPDARLFLKAKQLGDEIERRATLARFAAHGIDSARIVMEGASPRASYLAAYRRVDITLSTFPYPGGTTTAESLAMGVPVLCRRGDRFLAHLCETVVTSAGLEDWIAADDEDYVAKAVALAHDRERLAALRAGLAARVLASPLCDAPRFARTLEAAFDAMWQARSGGGAQGA
ncbi:tetratricopeptide repeat protein [Paraburkholderia sp. SUR17]|uniref:O-linked N-acetylglucosamine transferase, SPINDLY family protein n=1 Tax=Paraburkholderia sp. SUR17 TaxID=3034358 RepID=UPI002407E7AE|nr:tetratricopeptide repeat protein [Paraburkholderia sp. SUR17]WEY38669.1 tetratricopeptide repeat protein [Paraburkholderia sp. SUR17]